MGRVAVKHTAHVHKAQWLYFGQQAVGVVSAGLKLISIVVAYMLVVKQSALAKTFKLLELRPSKLDTNT